MSSRIQFQVETIIYNLADPCNRVNLAVIGRKVVFDHVKFLQALGFREIARIELNNKTVSQSFGKCQFLSI